MVLKTVFGRVLRAEGRRRNAARGRIGVPASSEFQQVFSVVPELVEGNQHMQYFFQQDVHHVGIMTVRAVLAQPEEIGGFQFRSVPFVPDDAASAEALGQQGYPRSLK
mgnify:CR=1 FL=1